jgi:hypothetical protein
VLIITINSSNILKDNNASYHNYKNMNYKEEFTLLTFYKFVDVADPKKEVEDHLKFCKDI